MIFDKRIFEFATVPPTVNSGDPSPRKAGTGRHGRHHPDSQARKSRKTDLGYAPSTVGPSSASPIPSSPQPEVIDLPAKPLPRVLLAEDNHDLQQIFARQLTLLGLEVLAVNNGRDAVNLALAAYKAGNPFDLVLMDLEMPIIDGYEATRQLRDAGFTCPILALSAHSTDDNRLDCIKMGCDDYLCKPIDWGFFAKLIRRFFPDL